MPRPKRKAGIRDRMYERPDRGWYLDMRDLGRGRIALIDRERGEKAACQDFDRAYELARDVIAMQGDDPPFKQYAEHHLNRKSRRRRPGTIERDRICFNTFLGWAKSRLDREPHLSDIKKRFVLDYMAWRGSKVADQTLAHELHAISNLMNRAVAEDKTTANPVPAAKSVEGFTTIEREEAEWFEIGEAARLLVKAQEMDAEKHARRCPYLHPVLAFGLLTGARPSEIFGVTVGDVDFNTDHVHFRHNDWRLLKRRWHERRIPLWPQLRETLQAHLDQWQPTDLLFPSRQTGKMITSISDAFKEAMKRAKIFKRRRVPYLMRHTYCATRLQTLDGGKPVNPYTVAEEMGHKDLKLIMDTYGHLQRDRQRLAVVEYREADVTELERKAG